MALFDEKHKAQMEENSLKLQENLERTVKAGPKGDGVFDSISFNFSKSLLQGLKSRKVSNGKS